MGFYNSVGAGLKVVSVETLTDLACELGVGDFQYLLGVDPFNPADFNETLQFLVEHGYSIGANYQIIPIRELGDHTVFTVVTRTSDGLELLDNRAAFYQIAIGVLKVVLIDLITAKLSS